MVDFNISKTPPAKNNDEPIPLEEDDISSTNISHSPLNLGGGDVVEAPKAQPVRPVKTKQAAKEVTDEKITGIKTFFAKLHAGSLDFVDEQIASWLKENPDITIKRTNTAVGNVIGKTTEPNIIITVWY